MNSTKAIKKLILIIIMNRKYNNVKNKLMILKNY